MGILSGLEKFGLGQVDMDSLMEEEKHEAKAQEPVKKEPEKEKEQPKEEEFLLPKSMRCPVCDTTYKSPSVKTGRVKRLPPDFDLRPRFQYIDTNKYDVASCPKCGYTAMYRYYEHVSPGQIKLIEKEVRSKFKPEAPADPKAPVKPLTYEEAIGRYQLALFNAVVKKAKTSERAYILLKLAWLNRGLAEELEAKGESGSEEYVSAREQEDAFYVQAYDEFIKAVASENFPMCGMDEHTVNILLAGMSYKLEKYDVASKLVSTILVSRTASSVVKDRALNLKEEIVAKLRG
ncbi:MAG: DUF2225 domain-containing protein [Muribaculaceae bacterium]|nr:DUF2225 domain-containing protein [Roseburia sp.]MCM1431887.1 DUF2225 domain-containing protein [Muribaculaceae bacterium]MCM1493447.1 DUF2225 domain-containing protein [Muribaculaceae bacterium]